MKLKSLGKHILAEFYNCDHALIKDCKLIEKIMNDAAIIANSTIINSVFHNFNPYGVSGVVVISESHLAIHTWPEYGYVAIDIFTCGEKMKPFLALDFLEKQMGSSEKEVFEISRGIKKKINIFY